MRLTKWKKRINITKTRFQVWEGTDLGLPVYLYISPGNLARSTLTWNFCYLLILVQGSVPPLTDSDWADWLTCSALERSNVCVNTHVRPCTFADGGWLAVPNYMDTRRWFSKESEETATTKKLIMINLKNIVTYLSIIPSILYYNTTPQIYEQRFILTHGLEK